MVSENGTNYLVVAHLSIMQMLRDDTLLYSGPALPGILQKRFSDNGQLVTLLHDWQVRHDEILGRSIDHLRHVQSILARTGGELYTYNPMGTNGFPDVPDDKRNSKIRWLILSGGRVVETFEPDELRASENLTWPKLLDVGSKHGSE